jgi:hypothetical protein
MTAAFTSKALGSIFITGAGFHIGESIDLEVITPRMTLYGPPHHLRLLLDPRLSRRFRPLRPVSVRLRLGSGSAQSGYLCALSNRAEPRGQWLH